ncbi:MAG: TRAP transporter substrate-binding protein [Pseudoflavonifractor sp.]|nr:TRAP transporter substrate-binding protein [Pseudoflavonifractor sp.]
MNNRKRIVALMLSSVLLMSTLASCGGSNNGSASDSSSLADASSQSIGSSADSDFEEMTLSLAHAAAATHPHNEAALLFAQRVSELTGGKVTVNVYPGGELGDQPAILESCTLGGDADLVIVSQSNIATYMPKLNALSAPFLFDDYDHAHRVIDNYVMDWINKDMPSVMGTYALSMFDYGFRHVTTKGIEVNTADDLKGVKIRVPGSAGLLAAFDALGSNTQTIAYSELYQSLKQGVVDAEENPVSTILTDCYYECQDQLAMTGHYFDMQALLINNDTWTSMSPQLQKVLKTAAIEAQNRTRELISGGEADTVKQLQEKGMNVTYPDKSTFVAKMAPAYAKMGELAGADEMDALLKAVDEYR